MEDLKRSARSYRADPRFNQYAKRMVSEMALGDANSASNAKKNASETPSRWCSWRRAREWGSWILLKVKGKIFLAIFTCMVLLLVLSRPLFYAVFARCLRVVVRLALRRSVGLLVILIDALLDEAVTPPRGARRLVSSNIFKYLHISKPPRGARRLASSLPSGKPPRGARRLVSPQQPAWKQDLSRLRRRIP